MVVISLISFVILFGSFLIFFFLRFLFFIYGSHREREREREAETQAEGEAGSMHWEPDVGFNPGSPGSCPGPKAGAKLLRHPVIPLLGDSFFFFKFGLFFPFIYYL